ncbi:hypothetical protein AADZ90_001250 [Aestuariibius sp. 2305UL40-4]|uniref:hypothetical protein n=1 Tax=Aestuariibius violaceus TaxID=3234132 RepID=UPI00345EA2C1
MLRSLFMVFLLTLPLTAHALRCLPPPTTEELLNGIDTPVTDSDEIVLGIGKFTGEFPQRTAEEGVFTGLVFEAGRWRGPISSKVRWGSFPAEIWYFRPSPMHYEQEHLFVFVGRPSVLMGVYQYSCGWRPDPEGPWIGDTQIYVYPIEGAAHRAALLDCIRARQCTLKNLDGG